MAQSWRVLHGSLLKIAIRHRCFSKNFAISAEQKYSKTHFDGCFWKQLSFGNFPEWLLLKDNCKDVFVLEILNYKYFLFLILWRHVQEEWKHSILVQITISFHYSQIAAPCISNQLFLKFSFFNSCISSPTPQLTVFPVTSNVMICEMWKPLYYLLLSYEKKSSILISLVFFDPKIQNFIYRTPGCSELFFRNRRCPL